VELLEEVLDTHEELILTHQAMAVVLKELGRDEEAEREMDQAGECAKKIRFLGGSFTHFMDWPRKRIEEELCLLVAREYVSGYSNGCMTNSLFYTDDAHVYFQRIGNV